MSLRFLLGFTVLQERTERHLQNARETGSAVRPRTGPTQLKAWQRSGHKPGPARIARFVKPH